MKYWEDIWKLKFDIEKCKVLPVGYKNIKVKCKLYQEIKEVNEGWDLGVGFNDTIKADDHIFSVVLRVNGMQREANIVLKIYKTLIKPHIEYCTQAWALVLRHRNWSVILIGGHTKKSDKNNKKSKRLQL